MPEQNHFQIPCHGLPLIALAVCTTAFSGCCWIGPQGVNAELAASQLRSQELYAETTQLQAEQQSMQQAMAGMQQTMAALDQERQMLAQQLGQTDSQLTTANSRIDNLLAERSQVKDRYASLLMKPGSDPLITAGLPSAGLPGFKYDELTGLSKFPEDLLFDLGSAELRPEALPVLKEFANQVQSPGAAGLRLLIVGHTDDQRIARGATAQKHPTNWHLSTDRADQVITELERLGVSPERMAAMGYSRFQPLETGTDESSRQRNRRVELYIVPESANLALWDPVRSLN
ncbi:MAG: OmpA family protein [Planctomycetaceae bacterium]